jgi:hypothetical protein
VYHGRLHRLTQLDATCVSAISAWAWASASTTGKETGASNAAGRPSASAKETVQASPNLKRQDCETISY